MKTGAKMILGLLGVLGVGTIVYVANRTSEAAPPSPPTSTTKFQVGDYIEFSTGGPVYEVVSILASTTQYPHGIYQLRTDGQTTLDQYGNEVFANVPVDTADASWIKVR